MLAVVLNASAEVSDLFCLIERQTVAIAVNYVRIDGICASASGLSEHNRASACCSPPRSAIDNILIDRDVVTFVTAYSRAWSVVDRVLCHVHVT